MTLAVRLQSFALPAALALVLGPALASAQPAPSAPPAPPRPPAEAPSAPPPAPAAPSATPADPIPPPPAPLLPAPPPSAPEPATLPAHEGKKGRARPWVAPDEPLALAQRPGQGACEPRAVRAAVAQLRANVVRVRAPGGTGLGLVLAPSGRVLTAFTLVEAGRGIQVQIPGEDAMRDAKVVAVHRPGRVALLEIDGWEGTVAGAQLAPQDVLLGDPVIGVGATWEGEQTLGPMQMVVESGTVTSTEAGVLRASFLSSPHQLRGSPVIDCGGRVVGVATERWDDVASNAAVIRELLSPGSAEEDYSSGWSLAHPSLTLVAQFGQNPSPGYDESDRWLGGSLGLALIGDDQWYFPLRLSLLGLTEPDAVGQLADRSGVRFQAALGFGYRAMLRGGDVPVYLVPQVGGLLSWERITEEGTLLQADLTNCAAPGLCGVSWQALSDERELFRGMVSLGLSLGIGIGELGYQAQLDPKDMDRTVHQFHGGVQF